jgi:hypothetical protein
MHNVSLLADGGQNASVLPSMALGAPDALMRQIAQQQQAQSAQAQSQQRKAQQRAKRQQTRQRKQDTQRKADGVDGAGSNGRTMAQMLVGGHSNSDSDDGAGDNLGDDDGRMIDNGACDLVFVSSCHARARTGEGVAMGGLGDDSDGDADRRRRRALAILYDELLRRDAHWYVGVQCACVPHARA